LKTVVEYVRPILEILDIIVELLSYPGNIGKLICHISSHPGNIELIASRRGILKGFLSIGGWPLEKWSLETWLPGSLVAMWLPDAESDFQKWSPPQYHSKAQPSGSGLSEMHFGTFQTFPGSQNIRISE